MRRSSIVAVGLALVVGTLAVGPTAAAPGDAVADRVFGQGGSFTSNTCNLGGITANSLCYPNAVAVDGGGNVYVPDNYNNRVLEYDSPLTTNTVADRVFGQGGSFTTATCNLNGISASSLCGPSGVAVDTAGNLYVTDPLDHRVLEYNSPLTTDTVADRVFGQADSFTKGQCNMGLANPSASTLCTPAWVAVDGAGNLYVADRDNNRVLEYNSPLTTDTVADRVFGQADSFTTGQCNMGLANPSASTLCQAQGVGVDGGGNVYVGDRLNNRVLEYDSPLTTNTVADRVFGQGGSFTTATCNEISASSLCQPNGVEVDAAGRLYVAEVVNSRVLEYDSPLTTDTVADRVFGQGGSFTSNACNLNGISASGLCQPHEAAPAGGALYVADTTNNRVLQYDAALAVGGAAELPLLPGASPEQAGASTEGSGWSAGSYAALAGGLAAAAVVLGAGWWYARRRLIR